MADARRMPRLGRPGRQRPACPAASSVSDASRLTVTESYARMATAKIPCTRDSVARCRQHDTIEHSHGPPGPMARRRPRAVLGRAAERAATPPDVCRFLALLARRLRRGDAAPPYPPPTPNLRWLRAAEPSWQPHAIKKRACAPAAPSERVSRSRAISGQPDGSLGRRCGHQCP
jgi:hypothetical protein